MIRMRLRISSFYAIASFSLLHLFPLGQSFLRKRHRIILAPDIYPFFVIPLVFQRRFPVRQFIILFDIIFVPGQIKTGRIHGKKINSLDMKRICAEPGCIGIRTSPYDRSGIVYDFSVIFIHIFRFRNGNVITVCITEHIFIRIIPIILYGRNLRSI